MSPSVAADLPRWLARMVPDDWFVAAPETTIDREEILVVGRIPDPPSGSETSAEAVAAAEEARIERFREDTRERRVRIARAAEQRYGRVLSWGAECGSVRILFTTLSVPAMTRLRIAERRVLDTLIDAGVARSRSDALAWCVRLVGANESRWLADLREAFAHVEKVRQSGPVAPESS